MEALRLVEAIWLGLRFLSSLGGSAAAALPADPAKMCYQELAPDGVGAAVCPREFTRFTLPESGWMVRR